MLAWRRVSPTDSEDEWGSTFLAFKNGSRAAAGVVTSLFLKRLPQLLNNLVGPREPVNLATALCASDAEPNPNRPLHKLAASLDGKIGRCHFRDSLLRKAAHKRLTDCDSFDERGGTVDGCIAPLPMRRPVESATGVAELTGYLTRRFGLRDTPDRRLRASSG